MSAPPVPYFGGKITLAPQIVSLFPPHEHYVEPYCGSLAVLLAKPPSRMETVNDLDGELMTFWRVLRDQPHELARACALTPHSRAEHRRAYDRNGCDDLERARRLWVTLTQSRSASTISTAGWRNPVAPDGGTSSDARHTRKPGAKRCPGTYKRGSVTRSPSYNAPITTTPPRTRGDALRVSRRPR